jgi:tetratricopeptide (TPR) repeat protein
MSRAAACLAIAVTVLSGTLSAADRWIEVKSTHFTVISNAGDNSTRKLVWQLEQVRSAMTALWPWMKPDLNTPLTVIVVKDENSMRAFAPEYWERRGSTRPASLWASGPGQFYLVLRTDVEAESQGMVNPYVSSYFSYVGLVLDHSIERAVPFWFRRGFTGVLSNTIVHDDQILLGPVIPWELNTIRERARMPLQKLLSISPASPEVKQADFMELYDAQTWVLVHYLLFGENGKRASQLNAFVNLVSAGKDPAAAFAEALGSVESVEPAFTLYASQSLFRYRQFKIDVSVERERFPIRPVAPAEAASVRATFHAITNRRAEARTAIEDARKADPSATGAYLAEALMLDFDQKTAEAKAAYAKAVELKTTSAYAHYRLALLTWQPMGSQETVKEVEALLLRAIERNTRYAAAYSWLGEIRAFHGADSGIGFIRRSISLEPQEARHRLAAARVLLFQGKPAEARADAQAGLALADMDEERREAQDLLTRIAKALAGVQ